MIQFAKCANSRFRPSLIRKRKRLEFAVVQIRIAQAIAWARNPVKGRPRMVALSLGIPRGLSRKVPLESRDISRYDHLWLEWAAPTSAAWFSRKLGANSSYTFHTGPTKLNQETADSKRAEAGALQSSRLLL
jgi:hypothetical protein